MELKEKLKTLPHLPGVYVMKDASNSILYVGKSKNLKNRVSSYFHSSKAHSPKVVKLVKHLKDFDFVVTDTEFEAFLLECKLIKELKPIYNRLMKNPLAYNYISISKDYLNIEICSEKADTVNNYYFGPYNSKSTVENAVEGVKETCKIKCSNGYKSNSPCLNYSLGICRGFCFDASAKAEYPFIIKKISELLEDTSEEILEEMTLKMRAAAEALDFHTAAKYRDYIEAVKSLINKGKVLDFVKENENLAVIERLEENSIKVFLIKGIEVIYKEKYELSATDTSKLISTLAKLIITSLKPKLLEAPIEIGKNELDETQIISSYLNNKQNSCRHFSIPKAWIDSEDTLKLQEALFNILTEQDR